MIIVKTKNGDRFINDKAVAMVEHERERAVLMALPMAVSVCALV